MVDFKGASFSAAGLKMRREARRSGIVKGQRWCLRAQALSLDCKDWTVGHTSSGEVIWLDERIHP